MSEILQGVQTNIDQIINYCHEETFGKGNSLKIGFFIKTNLTTSQNVVVNH